MSQRTPTQADAKKVRQQARKIIGQSGLDQLAEHDAALVHHASEIEALRARQDDMLTKAAKHAADLERKMTMFAEMGQITRQAWADDFNAILRDRTIFGRLRWFLTGK